MEHPMNLDGNHLGGTARTPGDVESLHELGLGFAEIPITDPELFSSLKDAYRKLRSELGVYYLCHGPREGDPNDTESLEKTYFPKLIRIIPLMRELEMRLLTLHLWVDPRFVSPEVVSLKIDLLKEFTGIANESGIVVCLENLSENATHMAGPFEAVGDLNLTLDLGHAQLLSEVNTSHGFMEQYPERIRHIHLHDNLGGNSPVDELHLPVGQGTIDFKRIFQGLNAIGYQGTVTLELDPHQIKGCLDLVKELARG